MAVASAGGSGSQHFLLKWNNHRSNMVGVFENLLAADHLVDVTLAVEGQFLKAHKIVLSASSPYFQSMFVSHSPGDKYPILLFHDIKFSHLKTLLDFMYRGEISIDEKDLGEVLKVAEALSIRGLSSFDSEDEEEGASPSGKSEPKEPKEPPATSANSNSNSNPPPRPTTPSPPPAPVHKHHKSHRHSKSHKSHHRLTNGAKRGAGEDSDRDHTQLKREKGEESDAEGDPEPEPQRPRIPPLVIKKKRGRHPKKLVSTVESSTSTRNMTPPPAQPPPPATVTLKPPVVVAPAVRHGVRRRIPRRYPGVPSRLKRLGRDVVPSAARGEAYDDEVIKRLLEGEDCEPLKEMSVRGLDLFKYAAVEAGVYRCMECEKLRIPKTFKNKYSFQRHAFLYHEGNMRKVFPCPVCSREFSRPDKMKNHMRSVHEGAKSNGASPPEDEDSTPTPTPAAVGKIDVDADGDEDGDVDVDAEDEDDEDCDS